MINEEKIKVKGEGVELGATIACSNDALIEFHKTGKKMPLVLLIAGTGSLDRDGNSMMMKTNIYKDLSNYFASLGLACVRYDKRGTHESKGKLMSMSLTTLTDDAKSVIEHCKTFPYIDENDIIVCGHSEGAMIATLLTEKTDLSKIILLAGAGMSLKDAMYYQIDKMLAEIKDGKGFKYWVLRKSLNGEKARKQIEGMFEKAQKSKKNWMFYRGSIMPTEYIREHNQMTAEKYLEILKNYKGRILALTGTADLQADVEKLSMLIDLPNVTTFASRDVNHMLRKVEGENRVLDVMKQYKKQFKSKQPLDGETLEFIKTWLEKTKTREVVAVGDKQKESVLSIEKTTQTQIQEKE
ncbi:MAG: alpha/beta hydrolase [Clostridia bacterium]|nr:alpha/beta hydrolase [Clostridia bacterium]